MPSMKTACRAKFSTLADDNDNGGGSSRILLGVFETLDHAGIPYCVLHGYESYPERITSDVDCMISAGLCPKQLAALFHENRARIGADLVYCRGYYFVFARGKADHSPCFLVLDLGIDCEVGGLKFYSGAEVIESRHRLRQFWVPATRAEFGCYLIRRIAKAQLDSERGRRLSALYGRDPTGCRQQIARFWGGRRTALITSAASSGDWGRARRFLPSLRAEMRIKALTRHPWYPIGSWLCRIGRQVRSACRSEASLTVAFLGPDGAGKSSVIKAVPNGLVGAFNRTAHYDFAPGLLRWLRRPQGPNTQPHAAAPRSVIMSVIRAVCYWFVYYLICYRLTVRLQRARSTLVLHDRHLIDALVDPRRYRYGGPSSLLRLIWRFVPKPDLVILLDAPPEVLQARKHEVSFEESARQRQAYRSLVEPMVNGHIVDAARPLERVVRDVHQIILNCLAMRVAARLGRTRAAKTNPRFPKRAERGSAPGGSRRRERSE